MIFFRLELIRSMVVRSIGFADDLVLCLQQCTVSSFAVNTCISRFMTLFAICWINKVFFSLDARWHAWLWLPWICLVSMLKASKISQLKINNCVESYPRQWTWSMQSVRNLRNWTLHFLLTIMSTRLFLFSTHVFKINSLYLYLSQVLLLALVYSF